ncbi:uncharacterized protein [Hemitrygon akajei]|uniref:uncharacterized protein n=1 Tax=Hemitrygon akajei TaxID=2704970 RepID=UPI003BF98734
MSVGPKNRQPRVEKFMSLLSLRIFSLVHLFSLLLQLGVVGAEAEREEVVGVLGSSVLLYAEITVDSSKNEILWTFKASNESQYDILDYVPGVATSEPSEQFKDRLQFNTLSGALTISRLSARDQGDYTFTVDGNELKIMELLVIDKVKEEVGLLGSSVLLDPELKVDPSKSEIVWTFIGRSILRHVPGHSSVEPSDQFKFRLHFNTSNGALTVNGTEHGDQGDYTFIVDGQELRILQLRLFDKVKEEVGLLGSSVLLDPELKVDPSKSEIIWTFIGRSILHHVPGHSLVEPSDQFKFRLHFNTSNGALTVNGTEHGDQGDYTFIVDGQELRILQLRLFGLSLNDVILIAVLTAGQVISTASLRSAVLPDQWSWKTLGGRLGYRFYFLILWICNTLSLIAMYIVLVYWSVVGGLSPLDFVVICVLIVGLQLSSFYINVLRYVTEIWELLKGSQIITIWRKLKAVCDVVLINCFVISWIVSATTFGLSTTGIITIVLSILLPVVFILILMCWNIKEYLDKGYSIKDTLNDGLQFVGLMLPLVNVLLLFYLIYKKKFDDWVIFQTGFFNLVFLLGISVSNSIPGFYSKDTVTFAVSITMVVLLLVDFISFVILGWKAFWYADKDTFQRWMSVYNVGFLIVIIIATISWMAFKGLRPEDVGVAITLMVGLVFATAYAIIFMCWSRKEYPEDKQWWWCLNICNIVALVFILIALICWIVSKDQSCKTNIPVWILFTLLGVTFVIALSRFFPVCNQSCKTNIPVWILFTLLGVTFVIALSRFFPVCNQSCKTNIPVWILFTLLGVTFVIALSRFFPVCSRNEGTNENNTDKKQDRGEVHELQTLSPGHEVEPENHPVS